jgi:hypothetical protein
VQQLALVDRQQRDATGGRGGDVVDGLRDRDPGLVGELVERVAAALRLEDVLRQQRVVLQARGVVALDVAGARAAALADDAGKALDATLVQHGAPPRAVKEVPIQWMRKPPRRVEGA